jgi:hypothetical protein
MATTPKGLKIKIVGCGGIGSWLVDPLCTLLNFSTVPSIEVALIDGDFYEERNRESQNFDWIGPKASVAAARLKERSPRLFFVDYPTYLTEDNIGTLIREHDIVAVCVDNHKTRKLISDRAETLDNIIVVSGSNDLTDGVVLVHVRRDGENVTLPLANKYHPELQNPVDTNPGEGEDRGKQGQESPQLVATNFAIASLMLNALYRIVTADVKSMRYSEVFMDIITNQAKSRLRR